MNEILKRANRFEIILNKKAGIMSDIGHIALDIIGLYPGLGDIVDVANALWFCREEEWLFAALSLISAIPELGDFIGKSGKIAAWATKLGKNCGKTGELALKYIPVVAKSILKLKKLITAFRTQIDKVLEKAKESKYFSKYVPFMKKAIDIFSHEEVNVDDSEEKTIKKNKAAKMNNNIIRLANRFQKILKKADGPDVVDRLDLFAIKKLIGPTLGTDENGNPNYNAQIYKDIQAFMIKAKLSSFSANVTIRPNKNVTFSGNNAQIVNLLNTRYALTCSNILKKDKRQLPVGPTESPEMQDSPTDSPETKEGKKRARENLKRDQEKAKEGLTWENCVSLAIEY